MTKIIPQKKKLDRKLGVKVSNRVKNTIDKKNFKPGERYAQSMQKKPSQYAEQLISKQRVKAHYGCIREKQMVNTYKKALRIKGDTGNIFLSLLEKRLDTFVYRMNFSNSMWGARQLVSHKHVLVNGRILNIPSYLVKEGDVITLKDKNMKVVLESIKQNLNGDSVDYIEKSDNGMTGKLIGAFPNPQSIPYPFEVNQDMIVKYYSRSIG